MFVSKIYINPKGARASEINDDTEIIIFEISLRLPFLSMKPIVFMGITIPRIITYSIKAPFMIRYNNTIPEIIRRLAEG